MECLLSANIKHKSYLDYLAFPIYIISINLYVSGQTVGRVRRVCVSHMWTSRVESTQDTAFRDLEK